MSSSATSPFTQEFEAKHLVVTDGHDAEAVFRLALAKMQRLRYSALRNSVLCVPQSEINAFDPMMATSSGSNYVSSGTFSLAYQMTTGGDITAVTNANLVFGVDMHNRVNHLARLENGAITSVPSVSIYMTASCRLYRHDRMPGTRGTRIGNAVVYPYGDTMMHGDGRVMHRVQLLAGTREGLGNERRGDWYVPGPFTLTNGWGRGIAYNLNGTIIRP